MKNKVIQFGEGNFLRGFVDYFLMGLKSKELYNGSVSIVQPLENGMCPIIEKMDCEYNLFLRGIIDGKATENNYFIDIISDCINPYSDFEKYINLAEDPENKIIISNTTEAGIAFEETDKFTDAPASSFPGKLTQLMYRRFEKGLDGFIILPCELIDNNGQELKKYVLKYAEIWNLGQDFIEWVEKENQFSSTLVDKIITGYPNTIDEEKRIEDILGYKDPIVVTGELFHQWVIEGDYEDILPLREAGFNVIWTDDVESYKKTKVRILNGLHTSMTMIGLLAGLSTVRDATKDNDLKRFISQALYEEILPTIGETKENIGFGEAVMDRFANPYIEHRLDSIALNSVSKYTARVLPTILEYKDKFGEYPKLLTLSLAALIFLYKNNPPKDDLNVIKFINESTIEEILENTDLWDESLSELKDMVKKDYTIIKENGIRPYLEEILG